MFERLGNRTAEKVATFLVDKFAPRKDVAPTGLQRLIDLQRIRDKFPISRIYYPGSGNDTLSLSIVFTPEEIVNLDSGKVTNLETAHSQNKNALYGKIEHSPFVDEAFDAAFIQDVHLSEEEFDDVMRTLKPNGCLIYSSVSCGLREGMQLDDFRKNPKIGEVDIPLISQTYTVFRKFPLSV